MLDVKNITAGYDGKVVLHDVSMKAEPGQFVGLLGPNGSGKTTLLRVISGILNAKQGQVLLEGTEVKKISRGKLARTMACLPQDLAMDLPFTVREVTLMGRSPHLPFFGGEMPEDFRIAEKAMELADVSGLADSLITEISGGERQRALLAMCLAQQPQVLLLDEPTNHLDIAHQLSALDLIRKLNQQNNMTVIAVFHDLNLASEYCDRLVVLKEGVVEAFGTPQEVLTPDMILNVYGAKVVTEKNSISQKPHIVLTAGMNQSLK